MMSENSSSVKNNKRKKSGLSQRQLLRRRLWPATLTLLLFALYHVIGTALRAGAARTNYDIEIMLGSKSLEPAGTVLAKAVLQILGTRNAGLVIAALTGIILALQGYSWMSSRQTVDFYESQPVSRKTRFFGIVLNSFLIFAVSFLVTLAAGVLLGIAYGASPALLMPDILMYALRGIMAFWASFALAALAAMLTGNVIVSLLATCVFLFYEPIMRVLVYLLKDAFFDTFVADGIGKLLTSPVYYAFAEKNSVSLTGNAVLGCILLALAFWAYSCRKNEYAGIAVLFAPVRTAVKVAVAFIGGLCVGLIFHGIFGIRAGIFCGVLFALIVACVMEIIYAFNFKNLFHEPVSHLIPALLTAFVLVACSMDLMGYDTWVPAADQVSEAAVYPRSYYKSYYDADGMSFNDKSMYYEENMHLVNTDAVVALARACADPANQVSAEDNYYQVSEHIEILYHMKNGQVRRRCYAVTSKLDPKLLDNVIGTKEFRDAFFLSGDSALRSRSEDLVFCYSNELEVTGSKTADYSAFREAYEKDLQQFDMTFLREHALLGTLNICTEDNAVYLDQEIYEGYDNTIAFLKENGLWLEPTGPEDVKEIAVYSREALVLEKIYRDPEQIREIMEHSMISTFDGPFCRLVPLDYSWYVVAAVPSDARYGELTLYFKEGEVPDFILN